MIQKNLGALDGGYGYNPSLGHVTSTSQFNNTGGSVSESPDYLWLPVYERPIAQPVFNTGGGSTTLPVAQTTEPGSTSSRPTTPQNTGGAGLAGNGPLIDALISMLSGAGGGAAGGGFTPSTAALEAITPQAQPTQSSSNPAVVVLVVGAVAIGGLWLYFKHKKKGTKPAA